MVQREGVKTNTQVGLGVCTMIMKRIHVLEYRPLSKPQDMDSKFNGKQGAGQILPNVFPGPVSAERSQEKKNLSRRVLLGLAEKARALG